MTMIVFVDEGKEMAVEKFVTRESDNESICRQTRWRYYT